MRAFRFLPPLLCAAGLLCRPAVLQAGTNLVTTTTQASGANWTAAIWKTNNGSNVGIGTAVAPVAGNTYTMVSNGTKLGNGASNTRVRGPAATGLQTFPGNQLTMGLDTEIRAKTSGSILGFFGVNGQPGLVTTSAGGVWNMGDDGTSTITGRVQVAASTYISHANNGTGGGVTANARNLVLSCILSGNGNVTIINARTNTAQTVSGNSNTFSGQWTVQCGWLLGSGTNSLGTNSITVDPGSLGYLVDLPNATSPNNGPGSAVVEFGYDINSGGVLTLTNGGTLRLHQNCAFSAVLIEGVALTPGTHFMPELLANYGNNIVGGSSGSITIQPFGSPPQLAPIITAQPQPQALFAGGTAHFTVADTSGANAGPVTFHWQLNGVALTDGPNISGSTTSNLTVSAVGAANTGTYTVVVANSVGSTTSTAAALTLATPDGATYEAAVVAAGAVAFYELNETGDPGTGITAWDYIGGHNGIYGNGVQDANPSYGISGPLPANGFPGFPNPNGAAQFTQFGVNSFITLPALNLNTNTVTITAWMNPSGPQLANDGVVFCRSGTTVAGLTYTGYQDANGNYTIGYNWNNDANTYNWNSGVAVPQGQWSFVALSVGPTNATIYILNANGLTAASHAYTHTNAAFNGPTLIGADSLNVGTGAGNREYSGVLDDVAIFNQTLSQGQLVSLYTNASQGSALIPPTIAVQPASQTAFVGQPVQFTVVAGANPAPAYQWQSAPAGSGLWANLTDGGTISGSQTATLSISSVQLANAADYQVLVSNPANTVTSATANLAVNPDGSPETITMAVQQVAGNDWNSAGDWSNSQSAQQTAYSNPGSTFEVLVGARLRTPAGSAAAVFPAGTILQIDGSAVFSNNPAAGAPTAEIRFKQPVSGSTVFFPHLIMNGGQWDNGNGGLVIVQGQVDIVSNTPIYVDSGGGTGRAYQIDAWLTGNAGIEYHDFDASLSASLNITGTTNTYSGTWNIVQGALIGNGTNSLGTNGIVIGTAGVLQTTYNMYSPQANMYLNGRMFLNQNDTFGSLTVGTNSLVPGTYTAAQLNAAYPTYFPTNWAPLVGATNFTTASGSITVLRGAPPVIQTQPAGGTYAPGQSAILTVGLTGGQPFTYQWMGGVSGSGVFTNLADGAGVSGSGTATLTLGNLASAALGDYLVVAANSAGRATSAVATVTVLTAGPAQNITLGLQEAGGLDWDSTGQWSTGYGATLSALTYPGSTFEVLAGARLRTPLNPLSATFPGQVLTIDGDGVWNVNPAAGATIGEIRFKQPVPVGTVVFPKLVMNGGQLDNGDDGLVIIGGEIDVPVNAPINNDSANDRGYQIDAVLKGAGSIEYHGYNAATPPTVFIPSYLGSLNITGTNNTYSGTWNVVTGVLLGSAPGSLGTNSITVTATGALETAYDLFAPQATLTLDGQLFLHQNDLFNAVVINGTPLAPGLYTAAQLSATYTNFPASWIPKNGSFSGAASGTLRVLGSNPVPVVPPPTPAFSSVLPNGAGGFTLTFPTQSGSLYTVQYKNNLTDSAWVSLPVQLGTGGSLTVSNNPPAGQNTRFYRIVAE